MNIMFEKYALSIYVYNNFFLKQRKPSVKSSSATFFRHHVLSETRRFASVPERRNGNINLNKYIIAPIGNRTRNRRVTITIN